MRHFSFAHCEILVHEKKFQNSFGASGIKPRVISFALYVGCFAIAMISLHSDFAPACDKIQAKRIAIVYVTQDAPGDDASVLIERLEKLVRPVGDKVESCNDELKAAELAIKQLQSELTASEMATSKAMQAEYQRVLRTS